MNMLRRASAGLGAVAAAGAVLTAVTGPASAATPSSTPATTPAAVRTAASITDVAQVNPARAVRTLKADGFLIEGTPYSAWSWTDRNGRNLFVTTRHVHDMKDGVMRNGVLRAYQAMGVGSDYPTITKPLVAQNGPKGCGWDGAVDFALYSTMVSDSNHDGVGEVTVGWWNICGSGVTPAEVHVAVSTAGHAYALTGLGVPNDLTKAQRDSGEFPGSVVFPHPKGSPSPKLSRWPAGVHADADALFHRLYH